jgi:uncharacterized protein (TIGR03790 family)
MSCRCLRVMMILVSAWCASADASAQTADNVALVINENSAASVRIGGYYAEKRGLPASNVIRIRTSIDETIERALFVSTIEQSIAAALTRNGLQDRILYLVLTKGVPLRIAGTGGLTGTTASVDSELTLLYRRMTRAAAPVVGRVDNPYFLGTREIAEARRFSRRDHDVYLVTRLDAFTVEQAIALIDRGLAPASDGRVVIDQRGPSGNRVGEDWLAQAAERLAAQGHRVVLEETDKPARDMGDVLGYYSWGSNDPANRVRSAGMAFVPGSIAAMFVSSDARSLLEPPSTWMPSDDWTSRSALFAGSPQSLIGDLIRDGATGAAGHVAEPYLEATVRPHILFPAYLSGFNLVEAFYLSVPYLSWQTVVIGDPLCAPFRRAPLSREELVDGIDADTTLPAVFSKRRLANIAPEFLGMSNRAVTLALKGEAQFARGDLAGARASLEESTQLAPSVAGTQLQLALLYDQSGDYDLAIVRYKRALELQPTFWQTADGQVAEAIALNNLAYVLAVHRNSPAEALPFARRSVDHAMDNPMLLDTLGWIQHLVGDDMAASKTFAEILRVGTMNAEIRLHAAIVFAATGAADAAARELKEALALDPKLEGRPDVVGVREGIKSLTR